MLTLSRLRYHNNNNATVGVIYIEKDADGACNVVKKFLVRVCQKFRNYDVLCANYHK